MEELHKVIGIPLIPPAWVKGKNVDLRENTLQAHCLVPPFTVRCLCCMEELDVWVSRKQSLSLAELLRKPHRM